MKHLVALATLSIGLLAADITMPKFQKYYISGIEFDTRTYCADFANVIKKQQRKIKSLETQVAQLQKQLQDQIKRNSQTAQGSEPSSTAQSTTTQKPAVTSKIIISDKPI